MEILNCDVCGDELGVNLNESGLPGRYGPVATLCTLHHAVAAAVLARHGRISWRSMSLATGLLEQERPHAFKEPDRWAEFRPVDRLNELYDQEIARDPSDWPPYEPEEAPSDPDAHR